MFMLLMAVTISLGMMKKTMVTDILGSDFGEKVGSHGILSWPTEMLLSMQASLQEWRHVWPCPARHLQAALLTWLFDTQTCGISSSWVQD